MSRERPLRYADGDLDIAMSRETPLRHADGDLDMAMGTEPPLEHADDYLDMAMGRMFAIFSSNRKRIRATINKAICEFCDAYWIHNVVCI